MKNKIEKFLKEHNLAAKDKIIAVGFSGGYDSMALLNVVYELSKIYNFTVIAAHLNHNWRGCESLQEMKNCEKFCLDNDICFYCETLDENEKHTETVARELRYKFFERVIEKYHADALLTAHTKSDIVETVIYRLIKGTGIKGLQGISPNLGKIYRPMLDISRDEVLNYCQNNSLNPNNDSSNTDNKYARNYIRNQIVPLCKEINPKLENAISSLSELAYEEEQIVKEYINSLDMYDGNKIKTKVFKTLSKVLQKRVVYEIFVKYDFEYTQERVENVLNFILENLNSKSGKKVSVCADNWIYVNSNEIYVIGKIQKNSQEIFIKNEGKFVFGDYEFTIEKCISKPDRYPLDSEYRAFVELDNIDFILRTRRFGDKFQPLGSSSVTKLKNYFINKNIPQHEKDNIVLLCKEDEVLWISGYSLSDKIKVVNNCTHVLTLNKIGG